MEVYHNEWQKILLKRFVSYMGKFMDVNNILFWTTWLKIGIAGQLKVNI
jgi:hypothetical protein